MHNVRKGSHWPLTLLGGISSLFNLFIPILMSRLLLPKQVGEFKLFFLYLAVVPAISLGVGFTNGTYLWGSDRQRGDAKIFAALILAAILGVLTTIVVLIAGRGLMSDPATLYAFAFACIPAVVGSLLDAKLVASGSVTKGALFTASFEFLRLGTIVGLVLFTHDIAAVFWSHGIITWVKLLIAAVVLTRNGRSVGGIREEVRGVLQYAVPISIAATFDLLLLNADRYVLSGTLKTWEFAVYTFGCLMVPPLFILEQSINQVLIPKLASSFAHKKDTVARHQLYRAIEELMFFLIPSTILLIVFAEPIITLLFTEKYAGAATFLTWYALYYSILSIPQDVVARAHGDSAWILRTAVIFGSVATIFTGVGAWSAGASGALKGFLLAQLFRRVYAIYYLRVSEGWKVSSFVPFQSFFRFVVCGVVGAFAGKLVCNFLPFSLFFSLSMGGATALLFYLVGVKLLLPKSWKHLIKPFRRLVS